MAGESPGKVEREKSSGEPAEGAGTAASAGEPEPGPAPGSTVATEAEPAAESKAERNGSIDSEQKSGSDGAPAVDAADDGGAGDEDEKAPETPETAEAPDAEAGDGAAGDAADEAEEAGEGDEGRGEEACAERLKDAVAAWVAGPDEEASEAAADAEDSKKPTSENTASADGEAKTGQTAASGLPQRPKASGAPKSERTDEAAAAGDGADTDGKGSDDPADGADAEGADASGTADAADEEAATERSAQRSRAAASAFFGASARAKAADAEGEDAEGEEQPEAESKPEAEPESKPESEAESKTESKPEAGSEPEEKPEPGSAAKGEPEPESDLESTSKFVALRPADEVRSRVPKPVAEPKPLGRPHYRPDGRSGQTAEQPLSEAELTRTQPRPDQEPLDLLAQLTNRPPKPETPLRVAVRRVKIWTPLVLLLALLVGVAQAVRPLPDPVLTLTAKPTYTFSGTRPAVPWPTEGQAVLDVDGLGSLGSAGKDRSVPVASVAKVMTAYVVLHDHPVKPGSQGARIPVDQKAQDEAGLSAQNESTVNVKKGQTITEREAIEAIMIASANNVARLLARWDAGSEAKFTKKMNAAAKRLGMHRTTYTDPSGLTASTVSTALDQVRLAKKAMAIPLFKQVVRMPSYTDAQGDKHANWNKLVPLDGVVGIKTGTTTKAGGNLIFAAEKNIGGTKQLIVGAVLGQHKPSILDTVLGASKKLIDTAQDALRSRKVVHKGQVVGYVDDGLGGRTPVVATKDAPAVGWSGLKVRLALSGLGKVPPHTAKAGTRVGYLTVGSGPGQVRVPVALQKALVEPRLGAKLTRIL